MKSLSLSLRFQYSNFRPYVADNLKALLALAALFPVANFRQNASKGAPRKKGKVRNLPLKHSRLSLATCSNFSLDWA